MLPFKESLAQCSAFRVPMKGSPFSIAVKNDELLFLACGETLVAIDSSSNKYPFKVLHLDKELGIRSMQLNANGELLALICDKAVVVVSLKRIPFSDPSKAWKPFKFVMDGFDSELVSVLWHPASYTSTVIVALTKTRLQVFDLLSSVTDPTYDKSFSELQIHISSIAFGSRNGLAGSLTLYLTTPSGEVRTLFPFVQEDYPIQSTIAEVEYSVSELEEFVSSIESSYPPRVTAGHPSLNDILLQLSFYKGLRQQTESPLVNSEDPYRTIRLNAPSFAPCLSPVIARVEEGSKLLRFDLTGTTPLLVAYNDAGSSVSFTFLGQFNPQTSQREHEIPRPEATNALQQREKAKPKSQDSYHKPTRGFGFVIESDEESDNEPQAHDVARNKNEAWEIYELKVKCLNHIRSISELAVLSREKYRKSSSSPLLLKDCGIGFFLVGAGEKIHIIDFSSWAQKLAYNFKDGFCAFEADRRSIRLPKPICAFDLVEDHIGSTGLHIIARSQDGDTYVVDYVSEEEQLSPETTVEEQRKLLEMDGSNFNTEVGISKKELDSFLLTDAAPPPAFTNQTRDAEDLVSLVKISDEIRSRSLKLSKFIIALNCKLDVQRQRNVLHSSLSSGSESANELVEREGDYEERISGLLSRQEELLDRAKALEAEILMRFNNIKKSRTLPLSKAESSWFRELNQITELLNKNRPDQSSLTRQTEDLGERVSAVKQNWRKLTDETEGIEDGMTTLSLNSSLATVHRHLLGQSHTLGVTRGALQAITEKVDTLIGV